MGYLTGVAEANGFDIAGAAARVTARGGPGIVRQAWQIARLGRHVGRFGPQDYYGLALWHRGETGAGRDDLAAFVSTARLSAFNAGLRVWSLGPPDAGLDDKLGTEAILQGQALPTTLTRAALVAKDGAPLPGHVQPLKDARALADWLCRPENLPAFGKPREASYCKGAVAIVAVAANARMLELLDGRQVPADPLAAEIAADWPGGYLLQPFYRLHADLARHCGTAMASVRITTLLTRAGPKPWYAVLYLPPKHSMHVGRSRVWGLVELASGEVRQLRHVRDPMGPPIKHWLDRKEPVVGLRLPHWPEAVALALAAHDRFPGHGIVGWDLFLTETGPILGEGNRNPLPVYQNVSLRGLLAPDMRPLYLAALERANDLRRGARAERI